jgi:hypothetical protein
MEQTDLLRWFTLINPVESDLTYFMFKWFNSKIKGHSVDNKSVFFLSFFFNMYQQRIISGNPVRGRMSRRFLEGGKGKRMRTSGFCAGILNLSSSKKLLFSPFHPVSLWLTRCQGLTPVILATQEAEIRKIVIWSQPRQVVLETLSRKW